MMLSTDIWRIAFLSLVLLVAIFAFATLPSGPGLRTVGDAEGNAAAVGFMPVQLPFGGPEIMVRCPRDFIAKPGQTLTLHYDLSQIHVFDKATTKALPRPSLS